MVNARRDRRFAFQMRVMRAVGLAALALAGCDSLASPDYVGEPMFTLVGTFATSAAAPDDPLGGVALMWQDAGGAAGPGMATTRVPVSIRFPATFRVDVPVPPPAIARFTVADGEPQLAEAYVFVVADPAADRLAPRGVDRVHALVFAADDIGAGSATADYLGGPISRGYHLRRFVAGQGGSAQQARIERCVAGGAPRDACEVRRAYQLAATDDHDPLRIAVTPP